MPQVRIITHGLTDAARMYRAGDVVEATQELLVLVGQHVELLEEAPPVEVEAVEVDETPAPKRGRPRRIMI